MLLKVRIYVTFISAVAVGLSSLSRFLQLNTLDPSSLIGHDLHKDSTTECRSVLESTGASALVMWAYDGPPDVRRLEDTIKSFPHQTKIHVFCGSTSCLEQTRRIQMDENLTCLQIERLHVLTIAKDTPLETWVNHHVLGKLLSGHLYERHLHVAMQLAAVWKLGGVMLQPGVKYEATPFDGTSSAGSCDGHTAELSPKAGGLLSIFSAKPESRMVREMMDRFLKEYRWDKPIRQRYNRTNWPVDFSIESLVSNSVTKLPLSTGCPKRDFEDGYPGPERYFGTLGYDESQKYLMERSLYEEGMNLGH